MISCLNPITIYDYSRVRNFKKSLNDSIISEKRDIEDLLIVKTYITKNPLRSDAENVNSVYKKSK